MIEVLQFVVGSDALAIPVNNVREVVQAAALTQHPSDHGSLAGMLNIRGQLIPIIDLEYRLGRERKQLHSSHHFIILTVDSVLIGVHVDHATGLTSLDLDAQRLSSGRELFFTVNVGEQVIHVLNPSMLISDEDASFADILLPAGSAMESLR